MTPYHDLGQYAFGKHYDAYYQAVAGHNCKYCNDRAFEHHAYYLLVKEDKDQPLPLYHFWNKPTPTSTTIICEGWEDIDKPEDNP